MRSFTILSLFPYTTEIRDFERFDKIAFPDELRNEKWKSVYISSEANESLTRFLNTFKKNKPIKVRNQLYELADNPQQVLS